MMLARSEEGILIAEMLGEMDSDRLTDEIARRTASFIPKLIPHECCFTCKTFEGGIEQGFCPYLHDKYGSGKVEAVSDTTDCPQYERNPEYHYYWSYGDDGEKDELVGVPNPAFDQSLCDFLSDWCEDCVCPDCEPESPFR